MAILIEIGCTTTKSCILLYSFLLYSNQGPINQRTVTEDECTVVRFTTDGAFFNQIDLFYYTESLDLIFPMTDARLFLN